MNTFSSREIATAFWAFIFLAYSLSKKDVRKGVFDVTNAALFSKLFLVWLSLAIYTVVLVFGLWELGIWKVDLLKDTLIWFFFVALTYPYRFHDLQKTPCVFRAILRDSLSIFIIVEVLGDTYPFSLPVELVIVPIVSSIVIIGAFAEARKEHIQIANILGYIQALIGFVFLVIVAKRAAADPEARFLPALFSSLIVIVLSVAAWPYICVLRILFAYEDMLQRIGWGKNGSRAFRHFAAFRILWHLRYRSEAITSFVRRNGCKLLNIVDRNALERLLNEDRNEVRTLNNSEIKETS